MKYLEKFRVIWVGDNFFKSQSLKLKRKREVCVEKAFKYFSFAKGGADLVSLSATGKTTNDHFLSAAFGKDCKIARLLKKQPICIEVNSKTFKYKLFKKGDLVSTNNVVRMKFPSEIYDFKKAIKKDILKKPVKINTTIKTKIIF